MTTEKNTPTEHIEDVDNVLSTEDKPFEIPQGFRLVTEEEAEILALQVTESNKDKWEIQEICDSCIVAGQSNNFLRSEFMYEYKKGNKIIRGLTAPMIKCLAVARGVSEVTEERIYTSTDKVSEFEVVVEMANPKDPNHKQKMSGFAEHSKMMNGIYNPFHKQSAHSKAFRNAALPFLPVFLIQETIYRLSKIVPLDWTPSITETEKLTKLAYQKCIDTFTELELEITSEYDITREQFANAIPVVYNQDNRKQLTKSQWDNITESLNNNCIGIVEKMIDIIKTDISETHQNDTETTPDTSEVVDIPETSKSSIQDNIDNIKDVVETTEDNEDATIDDINLDNPNIVTDDEIPF